MPRELHPDLRDALERANPYTEYRIEISEPDVGQVLRREDQFLHLTTGSPPGSLVSMSPANSLSASTRGSLILTPTDVPLASFTGTQSSFDLNVEDYTRSLKGMQWTMAKEFNRCTLVSFKAKIQRVAFAGSFFEQLFEFQVFRIMQIPGFKQQNVGTPHYTGTSVIRYEFFPMLTPAPTLKMSDQTWDGSQIATLNFPLSNFRLTIENNTQGIAPPPDQIGDLPKILFCIRRAGKSLSGQHFKWLVDTASARTIANIGTFERVFWGRVSELDEWSGDPPFTDVPNFIF